MDEDVALAYVRWEWVCPNCGYEEALERASSDSFEQTCDKCDKKYEVTS